ncbi:hypothetical protein B0O80DRAFT_37211 [Mortierella sp. GBAus27b]|nr:hypothetical protein B0O80DRAFT_37211 [Mortierella sp. GBAus27b]
MSPPPQILNSLALTLFLDIVPISAQMAQHDSWRTVFSTMDALYQLNKYEREQAQNFQATSSCRRVCASSCCHCSFPL